MTVSVSAMQWGDLNHIQNVEPIGDQDAAVLSEVREVLERHGCLERFGMTLLHNHFDVADDEVMMETTNLDQREHVVRPMKLAELQAAGIEVQSTVIGFDKEGYRQVCGCDPRASGHHHR